VVSVMEQREYGGGGGGGGEEEGKGAEGGKASS
jgi:hypothetical protein